MTRTKCVGRLLFLLGVAACGSKPNTEQASHNHDTAKPLEAESSTQAEYSPIKFADVKATREERSACERAGGVIKPEGRLQAEHCVQNLPDAGKACASEADCLGRCVWQGEGQPPALGTALEGVCEESDSIFGCTTLIADGKVEGSLCID